MPFQSGTVIDPAIYSDGGGSATLSEIWSANRRAMEYVDNTNSDMSALYDTIDDLNKVIQERTGVRRGNPLDEFERQTMRRGALSRAGLFQDLQEAPNDPLEKRIQDWETWRSDMIVKQPDLAIDARAGQSIYDLAKIRARKAHEEAERFSASRPGIGGIAAGLGGAMRGSLRDPLQVGALLVGGEGAVATTLLRTVARRAFTEMLVNGATEAVLQPKVQAWREELGIDHGFDQAVQNILFAAGTGGALGGGMAVISRVTKRMLMPEAYREEVLKARIKALPPDHRLRKALEDASGKTAAKELQPIKDALQAEGRAAIDALDDPFPKLKPTDKVKDAQAVRFAENPDAGPPNFMQSIFDQMKAEMGGRPVVPARAKAPSLIQFLADNGGLADDAELRVMDVHKLLAKDTGGRKLLRKADSGEGRTLDEARELAAEAGYIKDDSDVNDFLNALDDDLRGNRVYSDADMDIHEKKQAQEQYDDSLRRLERAVADLNDVMTDDLDHGLKRAMVEDAIDNPDIDPVDIMLRQIQRAEDESGRSAITKAIDGQPVSPAGIPDDAARLEAQRRTEAQGSGGGPQPRREGGIGAERAAPRLGGGPGSEADRAAPAIVEPGTPEAFEQAEALLRQVDPDGELAKMLPALSKDIEDTDAMIAVVKACKVY